MLLSILLFKILDGLAVIFQIESLKRFTVIRVKIK